ncbi:gamma-glutamyl-gamma-aminobutyrate hydrolase family protein [Paradesulfitobacterium ferrireducens]|uniref:gamma-glutamyl-gamma-aminobutyrate hydrolase family protein n=1 Tax=Paradesulfitobacterium ferrireducens TaxID=2816476 RepID=UPI001A8DF83A|nr:gamma-glutamyl-gamma-aminobutyrate hydrolase family protein [Paradesulfitobacterium ferrireducens]
MSKKPVIGITVAHGTEELKTFPRAYYVARVKEAGGLPVLLPPVESETEAQEVLDLLDGLILTGGGDISPYYLGEDPLRGIGDCQPERDLGELILSKAALKRELPLLGICRGIQVLAVAAGGKIYQDISSQHPGAMLHSQKAPRQYPWHEVEVKEDSLLRRILGEKRIAVNSFHHQAVSVIPEGFVLNALAPDGVIEGIEKAGAKFCIGVQWHPESMSGEEHSRALFKGLIEACIH